MSKKRRTEGSRQSGVDNTHAGIRPENGILSMTLKLSDLFD
jgi:hypothetical protein